MKERRRLRAAPFAREPAMIAEVRRQQSPWLPSCEAYWQGARRPLTSLAFVLPLLLLYEGGVLVLGPAAVRNGADVWLRGLLDQLGLGQYFLLPILTIGALLAWHHVARDQWQIGWRTLCGMLAESLLFGGGLLLLAHLQGALLMQLGVAPPTLALHDHAADAAGRLVSYLGAGIYEEVLFRLLLLPSLAGLIVACGAAPRLGVAAAVVATSLLFSTAHYLGASGEAFHGYTFFFRFLAGVLFALLFVFRGFGIAAGAHALYDILVGLG